MANILLVLNISLSDVKIFQRFRLSLYYNAVYLHIYSESYSENIMINK